MVKEIFLLIPPKTCGPAQIGDPRKGAPNAEVLHDFPPMNAYKPKDKNIYLAGFGPVPVPTHIGVKFVSENKEANPDQFKKDALEVIRKKCAACFLKITGQCLGPRLENIPLDANNTACVLHPNLVKPENN